MTPKVVLFLLLGIPIIFIALSLYTRNLQGAYYNSYFSDPSYAYLLNALNIVNGEIPFHADHPGTTVQLLGGLVFKLNSFAGEVRGDIKNITTRVLEDPESFANQFSNVLTCIVAITVFLFGLQVYRTTNRLGLAIVTQAFPLSFSPLIEHLNRLEPEPLLVACAYLLATMLVPMLTDDDNSFHSWWYAILVGIIMGIGIVTKITFAPLLLLCLFLNGYKNRLYALIAFLASVIILTIPIWSTIPKTVSWFVNLVIYSGRYGHGSIGLPSTSSLLANGLALWHALPIIFYFIPGLLVALVAVRKNNNSPASRRFLIILFLLLVSQLVIAIKHPSSDGRYMIPTLALSGFILMNIVVIFSRLNPVVVTMVFSIICIFNVNSAISHSLRNILFQKQSNEFYRMREAAEEYGCRIVDYYKSSSKEYALLFGNGFAGKVYRRELTEMYPDYLSYNKWGRYFEGFKSNYSRKNSDELSQTFDPICLIGTTTLPYRGQPVVEMLKEDGLVKLYRFRGWNDPITLDQADPDKE